MNETPHNPLRSPDGKVVFADGKASLLLGGHLETLRHPDRCGWEVVKHNPSRTVYRGTIEGQDIYVKHYHGQTLAHKLRHLLGRSEAMREMRFSRYLTAQNVPTAQPLAAQRSGPEWLATRAVVPATPADVWHELQLRLGRAGRQGVQAFIASLGELVGRMHQAGVLHRDLHCGNILLRDDRPDRPLVLMDLHRAVRRRRLSRRACAANLAQLYYDRREFTTRTERIRFLKHYLAVRGAGGTVRGWLYLIDLFARRHTQAQYAQRDRRIYGENRYFTPLRLPGGWKGHAVLASKRRLGGSRAADMVFQPKDWAEALDDPTALLCGPGVEVVKDSRSCRILRRKLRVGEHEMDVFIKYPRRRKWKMLIDALRPSRSRRAFDLGHRLLTRRIATALPLATLERRAGPFLIDSILITEAVEAPHLNDFMNTWLSVPPKPAPSGSDTALSVPQQRQLAQEVLWQLGRMLQQLHDSRFSHRDMKATNIRVRWSPGEGPEIVLVDLDGLRPVRFMTVRRKYRGLMRLNVSLLQCPVVNHAGRLRMLLGYLRRPGSGRIAFKHYWRVLELWSQGKLRQQIHSRRRRQRAVRRPA